MIDHPNPYPDTMQWRGWMLRAIDGDTVAVKLDLGFRIFTEIAVRVRGYDSPEVVGADRAAGLAAREFVASVAPVGAPLMVVTERMRRSFNRYVADVWVLHEGEWTSLADLVVGAGHGRGTE